MSEKLLPNTYKKVAFAFGILTLAALVFIYPLAEFLAFHEIRLERVLKDLFLICLVLMVFSKEKNETKAIDLLRLKVLKEAVGFGAFILILESVQEIIFWNGEYEPETGHEIMTALLFFYLVVFHIKKSQIRRKA